MLPEFIKNENREDTQILGTTGFAAPEQYGLSQSDGRADIYALGVLLNIMLTGEHPSRKLASGRMGRIVQRLYHGKSGEKIQEYPSSDGGFVKHKKLMVSGKKPVNL